ALDVLEDDVLAAVGLAAVDHRDDVRVAELCGCAGLTPEPLDVVFVVAELLVEHLDRNAAVQLPGVGPGHVRPAARADELFELVSTRDQRAHQGTRVPAVSSRQRTTCAVRTGRAVPRAWR